jgi:dihydrodipicolinate synthase/N-acetylneuraminate lyase
MATEISFEDLIEKLMTVFDVDRSICESDTRELLDQMLEKNIIRLTE